MLAFLAAFTANTHAEREAADVRATAAAEAAEAHRAADRAAADQAAAAARATSDALLASAAADRAADRAASERNMTLLMEQVALLVQTRAAPAADVLSTSFTLPNGTILASTAVPKSAQDLALAIPAASRLTVGDNDVETIARLLRMAREGLAVIHEAFHKVNIQRFMFVYGSDAYNTFTAHLESCDDNNPPSTNEMLDYIQLTFTRPDSKLRCAEALLEATGKGHDFHVAQARLATLKNTVLAEPRRASVTRLNELLRQCMPDEVEWDMTDTALATMLDSAGITTLPRVLDDALLLRQCNPAVRTLLVRNGNLTDVARERDGITDAIRHIIASDQRLSRFPGSAASAHAVDVPPVADADDAEPFETVLSAATKKKGQGRQAGCQGCRYGGHGRSGCNGCGGRH